MDPALRYSRQIRLKQIGEQGQERLLESRALIVGMGGLGSPAAMYLAAAGVGEIIVSDFDRVEASNLQRQIVHRAADIGEPKALSAKATLEAINPDIRVTALDWQLDDEELVRQVAEADVALDCSDNFPTRFALNEASVRTGTPLVSGAAIRMEGQLTTFIPEQQESPCYRCLYAGEGEMGEACALEGVLPPVVGVIGTLQALEAMKVLVGFGKTLCGRLLLFDGETLEWRTLRLRRDPGCPVCAGRRAHV
jgi:molybdopterin/thiamine biosynthesis adenylyltransferase